MMKRLLLVLGVCLLWGGVARAANPSFQDLTNLYSPREGIPIMFQSSNQFAYYETTVENRSTGFRVPLRGFDTWAAVGGNPTESLVLSYCNIYYTNNNVELGWVLASLNDGWMTATLDANHNIQWDPAKFPNGIPFLSNAIHTNHMLLQLYMECSTNDTAGLAGIAGFIPQNISNAFAWGVDIVRMDYPEAAGTPGHNARFQYFINQASAAVSLATNIPGMFYDSGWQYTGQPQINGPGSANVWEIGELGDLKTSGFATIDPYWTNIVTRFYGFMRFARMGGPGHYLGLDYCPFVFGYGAPSLWAMMPSGTIMSARAYEPGAAGLFSSPTMYSIQTNQDWIRICDDPLGLPGEIVYSNANNSCVVRRQLSNNQWAICLMNARTNGVSETLGFDNAIAHLTGQFDIRDVWGQSNYLNQVSYTNAVAGIGSGNSGVQLLIVTPTVPFREQGPTQIMYQGVTTGRQPLVVTNAASPNNSIRMGGVTTLAGFSGISLYGSASFDYSACAIVGSATSTRIYTPSDSGTIYIGSPNHLFGVQTFGASASAQYEFGTASLPANTTFAQWDLPGGITPAILIGTNGVINYGLPFVTSSNFFATPVGHKYGTGSLSRNTLAPVAVAVGGSPFTFKNDGTAGNAGGTNNVYVFISGGTGTSIAVNGTAVFSTLTSDHTIPLQPGETVTVTYSVAPAMNYKPF